MTSKKPIDYQKFIDEARDRNDCGFVDSCEAFLDRYGYLSPKQIIALENLKSEEESYRPELKF